MPTNGNARTLDDISHLLSPGICTNREIIDGGTIPNIVIISPCQDPPVTLLNCWHTYPVLPVVVFTSINIQLLYHNAASFSYIFLDLENVLLEGARKRGQKTDNYVVEVTVSNQECFDLQGGREGGSVTVDMKLLSSLGKDWKLLYDPLLRSSIPCTKLNEMKIGNLTTIFAQW